MQASQIPAKFPVAWASSAASGYIRAIPTTTITPGAASLSLGYPPLTFQNEATGGVPLDGRDENGILNQLSAWAQWQNMGGPVAYDAAFSGAIGGYPKGAWLYAAAGDGWWISLADNNLSNPDSGGAGWQYLAFGASYAGNPNGNVAGVSVSQYGLSQALLWDSANKLLWICTGTGPAGGAGQAVWTQLSGAVGGAVYCGTTGGTVNAQSLLSLPASLQTLIAGTTLSFKIGASLSNTGAVTVTLGSFGTFPARKMSPAGPVAFAGGEFVAGNIVCGVYDGSNINFTGIAMGTAAQANASSGTGTLAAVLGSVTPGHVAVYSDVQGSITDGGLPGVATTTYLNASTNGQTLGSGLYIVDTNDAGAFAINLPAVPVKGACLDFTDIAGTWAVANFTVQRNGNTIMGFASDLVCNRGGEKFRIWWNGSDWRLE